MITSCQLISNILEIQLTPSAYLPLNTRTCQGQVSHLSHFRRSLDMIFGNLMEMFVFILFWGTVTNLVVFQIQREVTGMHAYRSGTCSSNRKGYPNRDTPCKTRHPPDVSSWDFEFNWQEVHSCHAQDSQICRGYPDLATSTSFARAPQMGEEVSKTRGF